MKRRVRAYWRADFHPNETDERPVAYARLAELGIG
jgi:predicted metal-dependent hydrolase